MATLNLHKTITTIAAVAIHHATHAQHAIHTAMIVAALEKEQFLSGESGLRVAYLLINNKYHKAWKTNH